MSKEDELIWNNIDKNVSLRNNVYTKDKNLKEIGKRPSIFSYTAIADSRNEKADSLKIKFEDQNLMK
ncbi:hypothetical protein ASG22_16345 [Chryseobacterium sp. Leaf405]|uniref:hypothetical protein n=1 Tax=Chryseobacterium sp. Leaf405 TaxID=1736367 RepID=UPI0006FBD9A2|nr:hypothetical protein [Chryseobacterium sp. Leaf405]KQT20985.1 hypothetical protein ASG22_16345 [Chryseobacterium sp. Leaf405]